MPGVLHVNALMTIRARLRLLRARGVALVLEETTQGEALHASQKFWIARLCSSHLPVEVVQIVFGFMGSRTPLDLPPGFMRARKRLAGAEGEAEDGRRVAGTGAVNALLALAAGKDDRRNCQSNVLEIVRAGGIGVIMELARTGHVLDQQSAVEALASIAIEADGRNSIASAGGIPLCVRLAATGTSLVKGHAAGVLSSCCLDADKRPQLLQEGAVAVLVGVACSAEATSTGVECSAQALMFLVMEADSMCAVARALSMS